MLPTATVLTTLGIFRRSLSILLLITRFNSQIQIHSSLEARLSITRVCVRYDNMAGITANVCLLLSSCAERDFSCSSCHTAPVPCSQEMGSTSTPASTAVTTSAPVTEGSLVPVHVLMLKMILNDIQHSSSPVALAVLVSPWRCTSPPRANTVSCRTCPESAETTTPWRR